MNGQAYHLQLPAVRSSGVIFASPHSGRQYPPALLRETVLGPERLRSSEDAFVDILFADAPRHGAPLLAALAPRAWVDLNRGADELDPALIADVARIGHNPRVSSGLGVIPRVVANGRAIYMGKLTRAQAQDRLDSIWYPYHNRLQRLLDESLTQHGQAILVDCHSMPHEALAASRRNGPLPHVVLGDRFGASADRAVMTWIEDAFTSAGLRVARNTPFAGAYVTQHYGRPTRGQHAVQIEIDRSLYMDEQRIQPHAGFDDFRRLLGDVIARIARFGTGDIAVAAE